MNRIKISFLLLFTVLGVAQAQDAYIYMTLHNLGCRQTNHTYTGYIPNNGFDQGDLVQVILAGANRQIDPPLATGLPGGDDQLAVNPGVPFAMNPASFTHYPNTFYSPEAILIQSSGNGAEPALHPGSKFYVRAWNGSSPQSSSMYYNSLRLWQDYPIGVESCSVDSAVRTVRAALSVPGFITYGVSFDNGHTFGTAPAAPQAIIYLDSTRTKLRWPRVSTATSYRIDYSVSDSVWDYAGTTTDTVFTVPSTLTQSSRRLFRIFSIQ